MTLHFEVIGPGKTGFYAVGYRRPSTGEVVPTVVMMSFDEATEEADLLNAKQAAAHTLPYVGGRP